MVRDRLADAWAAIRTMPDGRTWGRCLLIYGLFVACALPIGFAFGLFQLRLATFSPAALALLLISVAVQPALLEELLFRAVLLPREVARLSRRRRFAIATSALAVYVAAHPINGWLFQPAAFGVFTSPAYLACAALLGLTCTIAYWTSRSIWPPFAVHWFTVVVWVVFLGGQGLLAGR